MKQVYPKNFKLNNLVRAAMGLPFVPIERIENGEAIHVLEDLANEIEEFLFFIITLGQMIPMMFQARKKLQETINVPLVTKVILSHTTSRNIDKENMDSKF